MTLTPKEKGIIELMFEGLHGPEIAKTRGESLTQVKHALTMIYCKFGIASSNNKGVYPTNPYIVLAVEAHRRKDQLGLRCKACESC